MVQNITFIERIKEDLQKTGSLKTHVIETKEDIEHDSITLVLKGIHDVQTSRELITLMGKYICDCLTTYNDHIIIRLF